MTENNPDVPLLSTQQNEILASDGRIQTFNALRDIFIKKAASKKKVWPYIKEHFRKVYKSDSEGVLNLFKSMMDKIESMIVEQFDTLLKEGGIDNQLQQLDALILEQGSHSSSWRPSREPEKDAAAHCAPAQSKGLDVLEQILSAVEAQNKSLLEEARQWEEKVIKSKINIEASADLWSQAAQQSDQISKELIEFNLEPMK